jgi:hypothetical protein
MKDFSADVKFALPAQRAKRSGSVHARGTAFIAPSEVLTATRKSSEK